jgi:hypothetical protein
MAKDDWKGDDNDYKGRAQYEKYKEAVKAMQGDNRPDFSKIFSRLIKNAPNKSPNSAKLAALKKAAAAKATKKSIIPASPTR